MRSSIRVQSMMTFIILLFFSHMDADTHVQSCSFSNGANVCAYQSACENRSKIANAMSTEEDEARRVATGGQKDKANPETQLANPDLQTPVCYIQKEDPPNSSPSRTCTTKAELYYLEHTRTCAASTWGSRSRGGKCAMPHSTPLPGWMACIFTCIGCPASFCADIVWLILCLGSLTWRVIRSICYTSGIVLYCCYAFTLEVFNVPSTQLCATYLSAMPWPNALLPFFPSCR